MVETSEAFKRFNDGMKELESLVETRKRQYNQARLWLVVVWVAFCLANFGMTTALFGRMMGWW